MPAVSTDPYAVFRPRRTRLASVVAASAIVVGFVILALTIPKGGNTGWTTMDSIAMVAFGCLIAAFVLRYARICAIPSRTGLEVRNLVRTQRLDWAEIVGAQFGGGAPWLLLDLDNTEQLAVMAIQRSDGERGTQEAQRLAALIEAHSLR